ncbi:MAG: hypothetical protein ACK5AZ_09925 [Bryobacteraceae bacterium]
MSASEQEAVVHHVKWIRFHLEELARLSMQRYGAQSILHRIATDAEKNVALLEAKLKKE